MSAVGKEQLARSGFLPGDLVEVRSQNEILASLDENGAYEKLPFMPEMLKFCGQQFRVSRQAFKTCVDDTEMRQLDNTVFLEEVRCDGGAHKSCDRACLIFWKEAWLKPAGADAIVTAGQPLVRAEDLATLATRDDGFFCQSSEIINASKPLPWWEPKQYLWDLRYNRISFMLWVRSLLIACYNKLAYLLNFKSWGFIAGTETSEVVDERLQLQPGDLVRVKPLSEIKKTLDSSGKHRNLLFAPAMATFCGSVQRVQKRVENIILEGTPRQRTLKDTVLLEGSTCDGICHRMCPRQSFLVWRGCWLERVSE